MLIQPMLLKSRTKFHRFGVVPSVGGRVLPMRKPKGDML